MILKSYHIHQSLIQLLNKRTIVFKLHTIYSKLHNVLFYFRILESKLKTILL